MCAQKEGKRLSTEPLTPLKTLATSYSWSNVAELPDNILKKFSLMLLKSPSHPFN